MVSIKKQLMPVIFSSTLAVLVSGCSLFDPNSKLTPAQKLDVMIAKDFKIQKDTTNDYRISLDEDYLKNINYGYGTPVAIPSLKDSRERWLYDGDSDDRYEQFPAGTYMINGKKVIIHGCYEFEPNMSSYNYKLHQTGSIIGSDKSALDFECTLKYNRVFNRTRAGMDYNIFSESLTKIKVNGKTYSLSNNEDRPVIFAAYSSIYNALFMAKKIDSAEVKQYLQFRDKYINSRNDSAIAAMKNSGILK